MISEPDTAYSALVVPFVLTGAGMAMVFPTGAATVLASVRESEAGKASGTTNAIREIGGVMGVAVLASVFAANGGYESPQAFTDGVVAALPVAVAVLAIGALLALLVPGKERAQTRPAGEAEGQGTAERPTAPDPATA
jgi:MFS family permease